LEEFRRGISFPPLIKQLLLKIPIRSIKNKDSLIGDENKAKKTDNDLQNLECAWFVGETAGSY